MPIFFRSSAGIKVSGYLLLPLHAKLYELYNIIFFTLSWILLCNVLHMNTTITIIHNGTFAGQTEEIEVTYMPGESSASKMASGVIWVAIIVCTAVFLLTVLFFSRLLGTPIGSRQPVPVTSVGVGNMTPTRSPSENTVLSPRTPQPYVDYVKRTIDETPYMRRGRRRFDPQYTYWICQFCNGWRNE